MNKLVLGLAAAAVIGGGAWYFTRTRPQEFSGTLAQAMKLGMPMKCTWQSNEGSGESYVKGEDMYVKTTVAGKTGHMIKQGNCLHSWEEGKAEGIKICQEAEADENREIPEAGGFKAEGVDWNIEYNCRPDIFAADRFTLPAGVRFLGMEEMFKGMMPDVPVLPADE